MGMGGIPAGKGKVFVLTEKGFENTPDTVKAYREIGKPLKGYEESVPQEWIKKGYVEKVDAREAEQEKQTLHKKESTLMKLSDYKKEAASRNENQKEKAEQDRENNKKEPEAVL